MRPKGAAIRDHATRIVTVVHSPQAEDFTIGTLISSFLSIRVSLVSQFRHRFKYPIGVSPSIVVLVVRVAANRRGLFSRDRRVGVVILDSLDLLVREGCPGHVMTAELLVTSPVIFLGVG